MGALKDSSPGEPEDAEKNQDHEYGQDMGMTRA